MKILQIFPYIPYPLTFGGALRNYHILKNLSDRHDVTIAGFGDIGDINGLVSNLPQLKNKIHFVERPLKKRFPRLVQSYSILTSHSSLYYTGHSMALFKVINDLANKNNFDIVQSESPELGYYQPESIPVKILDAHNIESDVIRRLANVQWSTIRRFFYQHDWQKLQREEMEICNRQSAVFTTSKRDMMLLEKQVPQVPKFVIPNGVDTSYFTPAQTSPEPYSLVFTGHMGYVPNFDGALFFLDHIFPLIQKVIPQVKIYIVGNRPPRDLVRRSSQNIIITGFVDDVRPYIRRASVYVVPLRMGGGTRLKVLEALAMKKAVVSTGVGCEGIDFNDSESLMVADKPEEFADAVIRLIHDMNLRNRLANNGHELVASQYDWKIIGRKLIQVYDEILASHKYSGVNKYSVANTSIHP